MLDASVFTTLDEAVQYVYRTSAAYAVEGVEKGIGGPFGAGIIRKTENGFEVVSIERNEVVSTCDPTQHAELRAISEACRHLKRTFLEDCVLVTTGRSCPMCLSAACLAKIPRVLWAEGFETAAELGFRDDAVLAHLRGEGEPLLKEEHWPDADNCSKAPFEAWAAKADKRQF